MDTQLIAQSVRLAEMTEMIQKCRNSGLSCREWCRQNHVTEYRYYYWQRKAREALCSDKPIEFAEIPPAQHLNRMDMQAAIPELRIKINGAEIELNSTTTAPTLRMALQELRNA